MGQSSLFDNGTDGSAEGRSGSFVDNMQLPIHRWFRYSAGFSAEWVRELIHSEMQAGPVHVLDPFAGSGTVLLEAEREGAEGLGIESHPFIARIAQAKLAWREDEEFIAPGNRTLGSAYRIAQEISRRTREQAGSLAEQAVTAPERRQERGSRDQRVPSAVPAKR